MILLAVAVTLYCFTNYGAYCVLLPLGGISAERKEFWINEDVFDLRKGQV